MGSITKSHWLMNIRAKPFLSLRVGSEFLPEVKVVFMGDCKIECAMDWCVGVEYQTFTYRKW